MKGLIPFLVAIALLGGGAAYLITDLQTRLDTAEFEAALAEQREAFAEQAAHSRMVPDDKARFDRAQLMTWHKKQIKKILDKHPAFAEEDRFINAMEAKAKEGKKDKAKTAKFRERYDWMKGVWDAKVKSGDYEPVLSQAKSGIRFDITDINPFTPPEGGKPGLKMDLLIWGPVKDQITFNNIEIQFVREIEETDSRGRVKKKKALAKVEGGGPPNILHPSGPNPPPMDWITEWPPGVMVGYYAGLPKFAPDATKFTLKMSMQLRTYGGTTIPVEFEWQNVEVRPEWRAPEGSQWDAPVAEATEEELKEAGIAVD